MTQLVEDILLVEDNGDDIFLMERALKKSGVLWKLQVVTDGQKACDYIFGAGQFANRNEFPIPSLIFLDLKLPYMTGFEVLAKIRSDQTLRGIRVIILTSSPEERDQQKAVELGADAYLVKPPTGEVLRKISDTMCSRS